MKKLVSSWILTSCEPHRVTADEQATKQGSRSQVLIGIFSFLGSVDRPVKAVSAEPERPHRHKDKVAQHYAGWAMNKDNTG